MNAMITRLHLEIQKQPNDTTCGPTCLQAVYDYYGDAIGLKQVIEEVKYLEDGGTLAVLLGCHALEKGYDAMIHTFDLQVFDPTWFQTKKPMLLDKLAEQAESNKKAKIRFTSRAYMEFIKAGGKIQFKDLTNSLIRRLLKKSQPIITGLSATYLYGTARERQIGDKLVYDDIHGEPSGHFVVLCGYDIKERTALLADPLRPNPISDDQIYSVYLNKLIISIMLGSITYDANLLVVTPPGKRKGGQRVRPGHHRKS